MIARLVAPLVLLAATAVAQERKLNPEDIVVHVKPASLEIQVGDTAQLEAKVTDVGGRPVKAEVFFYSLARRSVAVDASGKVHALRPGKFTIVARVGGRRGAGPSANVPVTVLEPKPAKIWFTNKPTEVYTKTSVALEAKVFDGARRQRDDIEVKLTSSNPMVAKIGELGELIGVAPGDVEITAKAVGLESTIRLTVRSNPVKSLELTASTTSARTGDVVHFTANTNDANGNPLSGVPVQFSLFARPDDNLGNGATGQIEQDGRFVAETPGIYEVVATCGDLSARKAIKATARNVGMQLEKVGHGEVFDVHTSDLWVWEGVDGRDYAVTGTWGANGDALFWDVTDPRNLTQIASVKVDARTVNDVKVSEDGTICVLSREGASNRKNGIVILDVKDPRKPKLLSTFTDMLTGGVHNVFVAKGHVYALSAGQRYDVINIEDPTDPRRVGSYKVAAPSPSIHDVWVENGLAYSSNWRNGVHIVDVGNGMAGGSPEKPVLVSKYAYPSGWNHAAFPFKSKSTGKFYVIAGDEAFPYGLFTENTPTYPRGWFHFIDFSDLENPKEVARYQVPEAGTHNLWVEGDVLYGAYYNGGVRVVDISGELMGDLYRQGREIAWFIPTHPKGKIPNASMVWGPQPHKGNIFFSDWNTGLWCVTLAPARSRRR